MKNNLLVFILVFSIIKIQSQTIQFEEVHILPPAPQNCVEFNDDYNTFDIADIDGDNDLDILYTNGKIYLNDGLGNYTTKDNSMFITVNGDLDFADIDNDGDQDVLMAGDDGSNAITKLYTNDGNGNFTLVSGTSFDEVENCNINFEDVDNDNDKDVLITGYNNSNQVVTKLYINDGSGTFIFSYMPFENVYNGATSFADVDNDNDVDLLLTGYNSSNNRVTKLYINDGLGNFSLDSTTIFENCIGTTSFADIDGDNDQDVIITGFNGAYFSKIYINDGLGTFAEDTIYNLTDFYNFGGSVFADIDNDNDIDIVYYCYDSLMQRTIQYYKNNGSGVFEFYAKEYVYSTLNNIILADVDNDNDLDLFSIEGNYHTSLYMNDGLGNFQEVGRSDLANYRLSNSAIADIDNDGDIDVVISGAYTTNLYKNDGTGHYSINTGAPFDSIRSTIIKFADVDGDNDQDILLVGNDNSNNLIAKLYTNDGLGNFTEKLGTPFIGLTRGAAAFADIDNDNDLDLFIMGESSSSWNIDKVYINDGYGNFILETNITFTPLTQGTINFCDIDGDNDQDFLITGKYSSNQITELYINDGTGQFTQDYSNSFTPLEYSAVKFADIDGDNDKDILMCGTTGYYERVTKLYKNNGSGHFGYYNAPFDNISGGAIDFADVDNDNDLDVVISGQTNTNAISKLYVNDGDGNYSFVDNVYFINTYNGDVNFADIDGDNDPDLILTGDLSVGKGVSKVYRNTTCFSTSIDTQYTCDSYTWIDGNTYTESNNTATYTLINAAGCDSIITLNLTINYSDTTIDTQVACNNFTWIDGNTYTSSNDTATYTTSNVTGCDSVIILNLTINNSSSVIDTIASCDSYTWIDGNTYTESNNTATYTLQNSDGCDSLVTLYLTITNSSYSTDTHSACDSYTWIDGNTYTSSNNSATYTLQNSVSCDSIITLDLTITNSSSITDTHSACDSYTWIDGNTYTESNNTATYNLQNVGGCDSIITLDLTITSMDLAVVVNNGILIAVSTGCTYQWIDCDNNNQLINGAVFQSYTPSEDGSYAVIITNGICTDTSLCYSNVGINDINNNEKIIVYPNPTTGVINVDLGNLKNVTLSIVDTDGKLIYKKTDINTTNYTMELKEAPGIYYIEISSENVNKKLKIIKEN